MTKEEFQEIIKPLYLLDGKSCQFIKYALEANFNNHIKSKAENLPISDVRLSLPNSSDILDEAVKYAGLPPKVGLNDPRLEKGNHFKAGAEWAVSKMQSNEA